MKRHTAEHESAGVTRLRRRLLAPLVRASELAQSFVVTRDVTARALRTRLTRLAEVSGAPTVAATTSATDRVEPAPSPERPVRQRRFDTDAETPLTRGDDERPARSTVEVAPAPETAEEGSQPAASDLHSDQTSMPSTARQREEWSSAQRAALEATARHAAEDAMRPVRDDQRSLAEDMRACRDEPPAFQ